MLEWIGVCCCSSFVSCICSLIATTFCLSANGVSLRQSMTADHARNGKPERPGKISPHYIFHPGANRAKRRKFQTPKSRSSCECLLDRCPAIRYRPNFGCSCDREYKRTSLSPYVLSPKKILAEDNSPVFSPHSKLRQSDLTRTSQTAEADLIPPANEEAEVRKRVDEYDAVSKQFKEMIEDKNGDKKTPAIMSEAGVSAQNSLPVIDTSAPVSPPLRIPLDTASSCCEKSSNDGRKLIREIDGNERSILWQNYDDAFDHREMIGSSSNRRSIEPCVEPSGRKFLPRRGWRYKMRKGVRKVCGKMIRGDGDKKYEFRCARREDYQL